MKQVIKRNGQIVPFDFSKIEHAVRAAMQSVSKGYSDEEQVTKTVLNVIKNTLDMKEESTIDEIQKIVEDSLMCCGQYDAARSYIEYRKDHKDSRFIRQKIDYITKYSKSSENAASNSNTDANANNSIKNVASIEPEVFKDNIRLIQRQMMKDKLNELFPEVAKQYEIDLNNHIIYTHDESNSPIQKAYCGAYSLYPLMMEGVGNLDGITPTPPNDIQSFSGQVTNAVFALSAQTKGAVALGDYIITLNYYVIQEFGTDWYNHLSEPIYNSNVVNFSSKTILREIKKGMKQFIFGVNQPQGNRGFQSPFTNLNFFDSYYFKAMFEDYSYPDGTKPEWKAIDTLQRIFLELLRELRLIVPLTFPVTTIALLYDENGYKDKEYEKLCADEWAKGSSHFLYHSNNADSLSSCCRVQNRITENTFSSTTGMIGLMTGSVNVITLNINRIVQDCAERHNYLMGMSKIKAAGTISTKGRLYDWIKEDLRTILERIYKYHIAYKTMMYDLEDCGMITYSNANYLYMKKLYSTIGVLGYYEAAKFLGLEDGSTDYNDFMQLILGTIAEENKKHSIHDKKRPFIFNQECIPGEGLAVKLYN